MLLKNELPDTTSVFYQDKFHVIVVKHFPYFIKNELFDVKDISGITADIYRADFYGLLKSLGVPYEHHRINTSFNGWWSPLDYTGEATTIRLVKISELDRIAGIYRTSLR